MKRIKLRKQWIGADEPTYIIAEIGSNWDGQKSRAKKLIDLAKNCGADAVKFQYFIVDKLISREGFEKLKQDFQADWKASVYETYKAAEFPREWHEELSLYTTSKGLHYLVSPYDKEAVDILDESNVPAFKIGSGDITWLEMLKYIASKHKPIILATGASNLGEIDDAVKTIRLEGNDKIILLQCVTNYPSHFESANIRAMKAMGYVFDVLVGYSDHSLGSTVSLGAVALGACIIEKHLTDDKARIGPDHPFALDGKEFKQMVDGIRMLEKALGSPNKDLYEEEKETVILQRRCLRAREFIARGTKLKDEMISILRPAPVGTLKPEQKEAILGREAKQNIKKGEPFVWEVLS